MTHLMTFLREVITIIQQNIIDVIIYGYKWQTENNTKIFNHVNHILHATPNALTN